MDDKHPILQPQTKSRARSLRRDSTFPERLLWGRLRAGRLAALKFRRQHPVGSFIVDFYCHEAKLVVELDGDSHIGRAEADAQRSRYLTSQGLRVVRYGNDDVLRDMEEVLTAILIAAGRDPDRSYDSGGQLKDPHPGPLPRGEGAKP